jgi:hypothetical protein
MISAPPYGDAESPYRDCPITQVEGEPLSLNLLDLELLHNYSTSTAYTLSRDPMLKDLWRINVPQVGFSYGFVMRGILALSALHLANFKPNKAFYTSQAMLQHQSGLRTAISLLTQVTEKNCSAIFLFSSITCIFALASPRQPSDFLILGTGGIAEWLYLLRGTRSIVNSWHETLNSGILGPMFSNGMRMAALRESASGKDEHLEMLRHLIRATITDSNTLDIYLAAVDRLEKPFVMISDTGPLSHHFNELFAWLFGISDEYLLLLREHTQESVVIFAHACVLLNQMDHHWWVEGLSTHLISNIYYLLDEEHRLWIRWPMEEIGWIPPHSRMGISR